MSSRQDLLKTHATFQDVLDALADATCTLPQARRDELSRAIARFCGHLGRVAAQVPADPAIVRAQLKALTRSKPQLAGKTISNLRSLLNGALAEVAFSRPPLHRIEMLPPAWATLWAALHTAGWNEGRLDRISPLLRFAAGLCEPAEMDDMLAALYIERRQGQLWQADPEQAIRRTLQEWNRAVREVPGWPQALLTVPAKGPRPLAPADFPQSLQDDIAAFEKWALEDSAGRARQDGSEAPKTYKPRTVSEMVGKLLYAARILVTEGHRQIEDLRTIEDVLNLETIELVLEAAARRAERERIRKSQAAIPDERQGAETAHEMTCVAYFRMVLTARRPLSAAEIAKFKQWRRCATPAGYGQMTKKNQRRTAPFRDDTAHYDLQDLPYHLFMAAEKARKSRGGNPTQTEARTVATAIKLRLFDICPIRPSNMAALHLERNFQWPARKGGAAFVHIDPEDTKTGAPISFEVDADTVHLIEAYRRHYLAKLGKPTGYLFPGTRGCEHIDVDTVTNRISRVVREHLGKTVNGQLMRHLKAMRVLRDSDRNWELVADTLGQRGTSTARKYYAMVDVDEAVRTSDELVRQARLRNGHGARPQFRQGR